MEPVTADLRESGPNEGEKLLHVMPVTFSNFFLGIFFIVFTTTTKKKTAKCDGYMRHTANESAPKQQRTSITKMTILKTKIAEC